MDDILQLPQLGHPVQNKTDFSVQIFVLV